MNQRQLALFLAMTPGVGGKSVVRILTRLALKNMEATDFFRLSEEALSEEFSLKPRQGSGSS